MKGACDNAKLGNFTALVSKINPALNAVVETQDQDLRNPSKIGFINKVALKNVQMTIDNIRKLSPILKEMEDFSEIK